MVGALWTGISGLAGQQTALDNESNNIANVNTIGYKSSRISFADQMYQNKIGKGTTILDAEKLYNQGNLKATGVAFDMALSGDGFFAVSNTRGAGMSETYYTRAGNFRMGDDGTLQDAAGNSVQGWAMTSLSDSDVVSTDPNIKKFTDDFVKLGASQIINNTNTIETITTKMTDYTESARADSMTVFTGAGYKTKAAKVSDVEALISSYSSALINYKNEPTAISITPGLYTNTLNYANGMANLNSNGDTISVYVDGAKYSQSWDTDIKTTMQKFTDQLSNIAGINAWITDSSTTDTRNPTDVDGYIRIESLIPGDNITISQLAITSSTGISTPGVLNDNSVKVEAGGGYAAVTAARDALKEVVTGKQQDVYDDIDLENLDGSQDYTYQISMYDYSTNQNISVPTVPLDITNPTSVQDIVNALNSTDPFSETTADTGDGTQVWTLDTAFPTTLAEEYTFRIGTASLTIPSGTLATNVAGLINADATLGALVTATAGSNPLVITDKAGGDTKFVPTLEKEAVAGELPFYVKAYNINGNVVIETLDTNYELEVSGSMKLKNGNYSATKTTTAAVADKEAHTFDQTVLPKPNGISTFSLNVDGGANTVYTTPASIDALVSAINLNPPAGTAITASNEGGKLVLTANAVNTPFTPNLTVDSVDLVKNTISSGRQGANAEFLEITSTVEQSGSRGELQLKLDTLGISNSPFGDFSVDSTGMIIMSQDGASFAIGQVAIALFNDNRGLEPVGDNLLQSTEQSGTAIYNLNNNKTADVKSNTLELSTADLSESLVNLMVFQRAFEANAKSITTADTILNTLIQLKR